jgi:LPXTG-motif cell wall-anchored protein
MYSDNLGAAHDINATISIEINSMPDLFFSVDTASQITTSQKTGDISIKVTNRGLTNIKYFSMKMLPSKQIKMISTDTAYIGDVDSDDSEVADFRITAKSSKLIIPLEVSYRDVSNNPYTEQINVTYNLPSASETGQKGTNWILIIIILIALIAIYIKRRAIISLFRRA